MFFDPPDTRRDYENGTMFSYEPAGWQKCPVCDGSSKLTKDEDCPACDGKRLINKLTGKPPSDD